jgi:predicted ribonuclease YlaK
VRLVVPLRVVEELDMKKASRRRDLARRAQNVLALLESLIGPTGGLPVRLSNTATIEVLINHELDSVRHDREPSADAEILDCCEFLSFVTGAPVSLATGDVSMQLRASVRGWPTVAMPDALRIKPDSESALVAQASAGGGA